MASVLRAALIFALSAAACSSPAAARAAFPGEPGPIAYSRVTSGETAAEFFGGIFMRGPTRGEPAEQLTAEPWDRNPSYSADGRLITFEGRREVVGEPRRKHIFVMRSDGSGVRQLTAGSDSNDTNPSFAPGGRRIVFDRRAATGEDSSSHIFSVGLDGSGPRQLTTGAVRDSDPVYTPDGRRIVFVSDRGRHNITDIFSMRPNGARPRRLIGGPRREFDPDVSPDGRAIVFAANRGRGRGVNIFTTAIDGGRPRRLTEGEGECFRGVCYTDPAWSPSGRHIVFLHHGEHGSTIEMIRSNGRGAAREFVRAHYDENGYGDSVGAPAWGPRRPG